MIEHCPCCPNSQRVPGKRRRNGEGSVYFDSTRKRWIVSVSDHGKRRYVYVGSQAEGFDVLRELREAAAA